MYDNVTRVKIDILVPVIIQQASSPATEQPSNKKDDHHFVNIFVFLLNGILIAIRKMISDRNASTSAMLGFFSIRFIWFSSHKLQMKRNSSGRKFVD